MFFSIVMTMYLSDYQNRAWNVWRLKQKLQSSHLYLAQLMADCWRRRNLIGYDGKKHQSLSGPVNTTRESTDENDPMNSV